jgi:hypothetical protein
MLQRPLPRIATLQRGEQYVAADASVKSKRVYPETVRPASDRQTVRPWRSFWKHKSTARKKH